MESLLTALRRTLPFGLLAGAGTTLAIAAMEQAAAMAGRPLGLIPFVTSIGWCCRCRTRRRPDPAP